MTAKRFTTEIGSIKDNKNDCLVSLDLNDLSELLNELHEENEQLKKRLDEVLKELYCKDRRLEELGEDIECCDKQ